MTSRRDTQPPSHSPAITFDHHEIILDPVEHQIVLTGFLLGNATTDLVVVNEEARHKRHLTIYSFDGTVWEIQHRMPLEPDVKLMDVISIEGRDRLLTYGPGRLCWIDPVTRTSHLLTKVGTVHSAVLDNQILPADIARDLNGDGRDDLVVPTPDGFWIATQLAEGEFTRAVRKGPPDPFLDEIPLDESRRYHEVGLTSLTLPWHLSRVHALDCDLDGRPDLVFWNQDHFDVYLQDTGGRFDSEARRFTTDIPFDADGVYSLGFGFEGESLFSLMTGLRKKRSRTLLHSFRDINGDHLADLITLTLTGRSLRNQTSLYAIHFGMSTPVGIAFEREAGKFISPKGKAGGMQPWGYASQEFADFNGDGQPDLMFRNVRMGIGGMSRTLAGQSVPIDLEFFRLNGNDPSPAPIALRKIRGFAPFDDWGKIFFPATLVGDINRDGCSDLLVGQSPNEMRIHFGKDEPSFLSDPPLPLKIPLPSDEGRIRLIDFHQDGTQALLIHHTQTPSRRLVILHARPSH